MASYDQLPAQQRAIVDLVLKRGRSYDQLADTLGLPVDRVRELARETLTSLAPVSAAAVDEDWRAQIADYLLGQQTPPEAASTRGHLRRSEAARAWSRSVLDSLDQLYSNGNMPTIPSGDADAEGDAPAAGPARPAPAELSPEAAATVRRRRVIGAAALAALLLLGLLLLWPVGLLTGGGDDEPPADGGQATGDSAEMVGQAVLRPAGDANRRRHAGIATVTVEGDDEMLRVLARLPPTGQRNAYQVWLYDGPDRAVSLGAQQTFDAADGQINFAGQRPLPDDWRDYRAIDVSREPIDEDTGHSGDSVLRARIGQITAE